MRAWTRRSALGVSLAAVACATTPSSERSLNTLGRAKGFRFGTAMGQFPPTSEFDDAGYRQLVVEQCGLLVAENEHKWPTIHPAPGVFNFAPADKMIAWSEPRGIPFRGHNLVWHNQRWLPDWVKNYDFGANPRQSAETLLREHITGVVSHYGDRIKSWDVINETVDHQTGELRETVLTRAAGLEINEFIFHTAREAAPHAQLVYNDYMTWENWSATHRAGVLRALERWKTRGAPIDALGLQSHIGANNNLGAAATEFDTRQEREWRAFLDEVTGMGFDLLIAEFDVNDNGLPADAMARDQAVAAYAKAYLDVTLSYRQVKDVLCWGIVDRLSWLQTFAPRADHLEKRCNPWSDDYKPKPMFEAMAASFRAAPRR